MTHLSNIPHPRRQTLLTILADLQTHHSDLLRRVSADLHEAASQMQHRAQEYEDLGCRSRKKAWELSDAGETGIWKEGLCRSSPMMISKEEDIADLEGRIDHEMSSSARAIEDGKTLRDLLSRTLAFGCRDEDQTKGEGMHEYLPVYDELASLNKNATLSSLQIVYELVASKLVQERMHSNAQDNTTKKRKRTSPPGLNHDGSDRVRAFIREQGLIYENQISKSKGRHNSEDKVSEFSADFDEEANNDIASLTDDHESDEGIEEKGPITPSSTSTLFGLSAGIVNSSDVDIQHLISQDSALRYPVARKVSRIERVNVLEAAERCTKIFQEHTRKEKLMRWTRAD